MSSHHFVRKGQEPALFLDHSSPEDHPYFTQLLEWNPVIISSEKSMPALLGSRIHVDHLLCQKVQLDVWNEIREHRPGLQLHLLDGKALTSVISEIVKDDACRHIQVLTDDGSGLQKWSDIAVAMGVTVFNTQKCWKYFPAGQHFYWVPERTKIYIASPNQVLIQGVPVKSQVLTGEEGRIKMESEQPFWVGESL